MQLSSGRGIMALHADTMPGHFAACKTERNVALGRQPKSNYLVSLHRRQLGVMNLVEACRWNSGPFPLPAAPSACSAFFRIFRGRLLHAC